MKWTIPIALLCGDVGLRRAASPQSPQTSDCRYVLSLNLALATASEAIRLRVEDGYRVTATVVGMAAAPQVALRGDALCYWAPNDEPRFTRRHRLRFFAARNVARGGHVVAVLRSQLATGAGAS